MTQIKQLTDAIGLPVHPVTHLRAVIDDNGNDAETILSQWKSEIDSEIQDIEQMAAQIPNFPHVPVNSRPANPEPNTVYLIPSQSGTSYTEEIYQNNAWHVLATHDSPLQVDAEPEEGSEALPSSGGTYRQIYECSHVVDKEITISTSARHYHLLDTGNWNTDSSYYHVLLKVNAGEKYKLIAKDGITQSAYAFFTSNAEPESGQSAPLVENTSRVAFGSGKTVTFTIPAGCNYLYLRSGYGSSNQKGYIPYIYKMLGINDMMLRSEGEAKIAEGDVVVEDNLHWQFCGVYHKFALTINSSNTIVEGSLSQGVQKNYLAYRTCVKDELFKVRAISDANKVWFSETAPAEGGTCTMLKSIPSGEYVIVKAPANGYILSLNVKGVRSAIFYKTKSFDLDIYAAHKIEIENSTAQKGLVVDENSENYGQLANLSSSNYLTTDFINVNGYVYVGIPIHYTTSVGVTLMESDDKYGAIFFRDGDTENEEPEKVIVSVADVTENYRMSSGESMCVVYKVPSGAKYVRFTYYTGNSYMIGYDRNFSYDDDNLPAIVKRNDVEKTKRILNQITNYTRASYNDEKPEGTEPAYPHEDTVAKAKPLVLLHFSDIHGAGSNLNNINDYREYYAKYIDDTIHTGDSVAEKWSSDFTFWSGNAKNNDILNVIGNHDTRYSSSDEHHYDGKDSYDRYFAPFIDNWGIRQPEDAETKGKCYYYKDYEAKKIRLIVIDAWVTDSEYQAEQLEWFNDKLDLALQNDLSVIVASHFRINCEGGEALDTPFSWWKNLPLTPAEDKNSSYVECVKNFINLDGKFICWLTGHSHYNGISVRHDVVNEGTANEKTIKQLNICIGNASKDVPSNWSKNFKIYNDGIAPVADDDRSKDMFNILAIDTHYSTITMLRVGADYDKWGRHIETCCIDYENCKMVY